MFSTLMNLLTIGRKPNSNIYAMIQSLDDILSDKNGLKLHFYKLNDSGKYQPIVAGLPTGHMFESETKQIIESGYQIGTVASMRDSR